MNGKILFWFLVFLLNIPLNRLFGQISSADTLNLTSSLTEQKDVADYYRKVFKKEFTTQKDSSKSHSLGPFYTPIIYPGYALVTGGLIGFVSNLSFCTHRGKDAKISTILTDNVYTQYHQSINAIRSNIWLNHEKFNLLGDWRYYKFPTNTFGLGSKTSLNYASAIDYSLLRIYEVVLKQVTKNILVGAGYNLDYHLNISETNTPIVENTDFNKYGFTKSSVSSGLTLNFQFDNRLNSNNPQAGYFANLQIRDNLRFLGSDNNWQSAILDMRHYIPLSAKSGNRLALWIYNVLTLGGTPPYLDLPSTGWDTFNNTARGYVEGRFQGLNLLYFETEFRFNILKNGFLGGVIFSNASTLTEPLTHKFEKINPALGIGLRIKVNKFSNTNIAIDFAKGSGGSGGFSFGLNEMF